MAIQNFLSGGFYGKLGDVVGQRWRNKRTVRAHVIPFNPRTEKQQSNRQQFALATSLAQQAFNINRGWDMWQRPDMGQFSFMVSVAKLRLQRGMSPAQALPLYPDNFDPSVVIRNPSFDWSEWSSWFSITDASYTVPTRRRFEVILNCYDLKLEQWVLHKYEESILPDLPFTLNIAPEGQFAFPSGSTVQGVTIDDDQHDNISISLPVVSFTQPTKLTVDIDIEDWWLNLNDMPEFLYFHCDTEYPQLFDDFNIQVRCRSIATGQMVNVWTVGHFEDPFMGNIPFECEDYNFPAGSSLLAANFTYSNHPYADFVIFIQPFPFTA
jgi:hypothetical protein